MKHYPILALGVVAMAFAAVLIRLADSPPLVTAAYRLGIAVVVLAPVVFWKARADLRRLPMRDFLLAVAAGLFLSLHFGLWITSLDYTTVASSVVLVTATPIFVAVASYLLFREKITARIVLGIGISIAGAVVIGYANWQAGGQSLLGSALSLGGAVAVAGYLLIGRGLRKRMGLLVYIFLSYTAAAVFLLTAVLVTGQPLGGYAGDTYLMFLLLALGPQLLGHSSLNWALKYMPATMVTIAVLGEPVGATILAALMLGELPATLEIVGGMLILGGIVTAFSKGDASQGMTTPSPR